METVTVLILNQEEKMEFEGWVKKIPGFKVINSTTNMDIGYTQAERYQPTLILLNIDTPGNEGLVLAEVFVGDFPASSIILITKSDNKKVLRHALSIGAQGVINLPIAEEKFMEIVQRSVQRDAKRRELFSNQQKQNPQFKTIVVFGLKGGVGKTTIATNLAIALRKITGKRVALVDLDLFGGNVHLATGISWNRTIKDLVDELGDLDAELLDAYCAEHSSGIKIIPAPSNPEVASFIQAEHIEKLLKKISNSFNYVVIDTPSTFNDIVLPAFERAKDILMVTTMDIASLHNLKKSLEFFDNFNLRRKTRVVVNKAGYTGGIKLKDLKDVMGFEPVCVLPNCEKQMIDAINNGEPILLSAINSKASREIELLASRIANQDKALPEAVKQVKKGKKRFFPFFQKQDSISR